MFIHAFHGHVFFPDHLLVANLDHAILLSPSTQLRSATSHRVRQEKLWTKHEHWEVILRDVMRCFTL